MIVEFTERKRAEISEREANKVAIEQIYKICKIPYRAFIRNGKLIESVEYATSHRWFEDEIRREATTQDYWALEIIKKLKADIVEKSVPNLKNLIRVANRGEFGEVSDSGIEKILNEY